MDFRDVRCQTRHIRADFLKYHKVLVDIHGRELIDKITEL